MAVSYPYSLPSFADLLKISSIVWDIQRNDELSGSGDGRVWQAELAPPLWTGTVTLADMYNAEAKQIAARIRKLHGAQEALFLYDPLSKYPQADPKKTPSSSKEAAQISSAVDWPETPGSLLTIVAGWSPEAASVDLYAYVASKLYAVETGGIVLDSMRVMTDRSSQSLITGAYNYVQANPNVTVKFKTAAGFVDLTAAQMTAIADAVGAHVQAAFAAEGEVSSRIIAGQITTVAEIDAFDWPSNSSI